MTTRVRVGCMKFRELSGGIVWKEMVSENEREGVLFMCESSDGVRW